MGQGNEAEMGCGSRNPRMTLKSHSELPTHFID
jgi:hypothetical protein